MNLKHPLSFVAIALLLILPGCASENPAGDGSLPSLEGSFDGVYYNTSGAAGSGGETLTISTSGDASLVRNGITYTGHVGGYQLVVKSPSGTIISGTIAKTGKYWTLTYTESDGTKGTNPFGRASTASPFMGSYSGTYQAGTVVGNVLMNISAAGAVSSAFTPPGGGAYGAAGFEDDDGDMFLHYYNTTLAAYQIAVGITVLTAGRITGTFNEIPSGNTFTVDEH